jgi:8-oxo-dGTP pyrophosphatase MutT (NUDIX family)
VEWMRVDRPFSSASIRLFSSSRTSEYARQKVKTHVLRDYNLTTTFRYSLLDEAPPEVQDYPWVSAADLQRLRNPPRRVKMVARK